MRTCEVWHLGLMPYRDGWDLQNHLADARGRDEIRDRLLLLSHPHTYTFGSSGRDEHLLIPASELAHQGVDVLRVDRGGDITYHGPGQLVGYPILRLARSSDFRADVLGYIRNLEQSVILTLSDYGVPAYTIPGLTGVWVGSPGDEAKICAIGVKVTTRAVTKHGFALNLNTNLDRFQAIVPCGIHDKGVTSLGALLKTRVDETEAAQRLIHHFGRVFGLMMVTTPQPPTESGQYF